MIVQPQVCQLPSPHPTGIGSVLNKGEKTKILNQEQTYNVVETIPPCMHTNEAVILYTYIYIDKLFIHNQLNQ